MTKVSSQPTLRPPIIAILLAIGIAVVLVCRVHAKPAGAVGLFGRIDVLACALIFSVPLAIRLASKLESLPRFHKLAAAAALLTIGELLFHLAQTLSVGDRSGEMALAFWRAFIVIPMTTAAVVGCYLLPKSRASVNLDLPRWIDLGLLGLALIVPAVYADAIADGIRSNLRQSLQNERLALAHRQTQQLRQLKPQWSVHGISVIRVEQELAARVADLTHQAAVPLADHASPLEIGRRVTVLVQLERNREALRLVEPLTQGKHMHPIALDYLALCYQRLEMAQESVTAYQNAVDYWNKQSDSGAKTKGLVSAYKGIGYGARRLQDRALEEQAYRRLVQIAPSAESHFLLAQCYREHQKSKLAAEHATIAVEFDSTFGEEAEAMLSTLETDHFGCLQIPRR